jgi:hypothetical protein
MIQYITDTVLELLLKQAKQDRFIDLAFLLQSLKEFFGLGMHPMWIELARALPPWRKRQFKIRVGEDSCDICQVFFFFLIDKNNFNLRKVVGGCGNLTQSGLFALVY